MLIQQQVDAVAVQAPAKVNLFLEILGKRPDGYHEIVTFMAAVRLFDNLTFKEDPTGTIHLTCSDPSLSAGRDNLVWRAADLLRRAAKSRRGCRIHLHKRIPAGAGLGGGSSDAAATLLGLSWLWQLNLGLPTLTELAGQLGSDVPFFITAKAAWCTGRGEKIEPVWLRKPLHLVLACPAQGVSTAEVYGRVRVPRRPIQAERFQEALADGRTKAMGAGLHNRLRPAAEQLCPAIGKVRRLFAELDFGGHGMSGSGSSYFGLCDRGPQALEQARRLRQAAKEKSVPLTVFAIRTL